MNRILIIEDEKNIRDSLKRKAESINSRLEIFCTGSVEESLKIVDKHSIDAFFVDIQLEDGSGYELVKKLREIKAYQFTPVVFITGIITREVEAYRHLHCYYFLIKPYSDEELEHTMKEILLDYMKEEEKEQKDLVLDFKGFKQILHLDELMYIEYASRKLTFFMTDGPMPYKHKSLKSIEERLPFYFKRVHQAFIVNQHHVTDFNKRKKVIHVSGSPADIPVGSSYVKDVEEWFDVGE